MRYKCPVCGYIYDPEQGDEHSGVEAGTLFEDLPPDGHARYAELLSMILKNTIRNALQVYA